MATAAELSVARARVAQAAAGDRQAQAWLVDHLMPMVRKVTRAMLSSAVDADDAAQLAFMEILKSARTYRGDAPVTPWARRIVVRCTLKYARKERKCQTAEPIDRLEDRPARPERRAWESLPRGVADYLRELPEPQRQAIVLHHALGHSLDEIAELTGVSPNTVKGRLRLGTQALRKLVRRELLIGAPDDTRRDAMIMGAPGARDAGAAKQRKGRGR